MYFLRKLAILSLLALEVVYAAPSRPCTLLSVATGDATLEFASPASQMPVLSPLPYTQDFILKLTGDAQLHALRANEQAQGANAELLLADQTDRKERRLKAEEKLSATPLGRAVKKMSVIFAESFPKNGSFVNVLPNTEGYVASADGAVFVRLLFSEPKITPPVAPVPNVSNEPVKVSLPIMLKVESVTGETLFLKNFEQTKKIPNPDGVIGKNYDGVIESLVKESMTEVMKILTQLYE